MTKMIPGHLPPRPLGISRVLWMRAYLESWLIALRTSTPGEARKQASGWAAQQEIPQTDPADEIRRLAERINRLAERIKKAQRGT
jgi:HAMP domain-containing protein